MVGMIVNKKIPIISKEIDIVMFEMLRKWRKKFFEIGLNSRSNKRSPRTL